ncbi:hypothetical protein JCM10908_001111 [Rhodotorula pacifica]|uniref:uncharacterized protein n=1 Tax=Rhodotorula pacifica TaxID=1495444 RepID=UPI00317F7B07
MAISAQLAQEWLGDEYEQDYQDEDVVYLDGQDDDNDEYGPGVTIFAEAEEDGIEPEPTTDLADQAYADPLALVNAWEGALQDYKDSHPNQFLPPTEAPRSLAQKQTKAPFWYGPPPSEASTSKLAMVTTTAKTSNSKQPHEAVEVTYESYFGATAQGGSCPPLEQEQGRGAEDEEEEEEEGANRRKRKRLTGSQKKARKAAKLGIKSHTTPRGGTDNGGGGGGGAGDSLSSPAGHAAVREPSPVYSPRSPRMQAAPEVEPPATGSTPFPFPVPAGSATDPSLSSVPPAAALPPTARPDTGQEPPLHSAPPPPPSAFRFVVPPMTSLPTRFPPPPAITPLTGHEPPLDAETPEQLLESALWSWYSAGYQTALYHAAVGVAKFAPSENENGNGTAAAAEE